MNPNNSNIMAGIKDLDILLSNIEPILNERDFVFCSFPSLDWEQISELAPIGIFHEKEGITLIIDREDAVNRDIVINPYINLLL